jgi:MFS family permease
MLARRSLRYERAAWTRQQKSPPIPPRQQGLKSFVALGRRRILLPAIALEIVSAVIFIVWPEFGGLIAARVVSGLGIGMLTATVTAHILDLHLKSRPGADPARGQIVSGAANLGGFGAGALVSGLLAR